MPQAKDIPTELILRIINELGARFLERCNRPPRYDCAWATIWDIEASIDTMPKKVVLAKLRKLMKAGYITGCDCGCRGDYELLDKARDEFGDEFGDLESVEVVQVYS